MKFKFWGVRGSIPAPGPHTVKYGGNTTCIEVRAASNELLILDAGTGIHALAQNLPRQTTLTAHIFLTHTHWDHIQGLPFFLPIFGAGNHIHIYGADDDITGLGIERALTAQLQHSFFPIIPSQLHAEISYHRLESGVGVEIGGARIMPLALQHPVINLGYRIDDSDGGSLFFTGDYEPPRNQDAVDDAELTELRQLAGGVDVLIVDASYTEDEYRDRINWGHGTFESGIQLARQLHAKRLYFTHHEPSRSDSELETIYRGLPRPPTGLAMHLAREGMGYIDAAIQA